MIVIYINGEGTAKKLSPQHVYQGSNQTGVTVFAPVPTTTAISIAFKLPDGTSSPYYPMTFIQSVEGLSQFEFTIPSSITQLAGQASIALRTLYSDGQQTSQLIEFEIEPSVLPELPEDIDQSAYDIIMQYLQQDRSDITTLQGQIDHIEELSESAQTASANAVETASEAKTTADGLADSIAQSNAKANLAIATANQANNTANGAVQEIAEYKTSVDAKIEELEEQIVDGAGTAVEVDGEKQTNLSFTSDPQTQLDEKVNTLSNATLSSLLVENQNPVATGTAIHIRSKSGMTLGVISAPNYISGVDTPYIEVLNAQNTVLANIQIPQSEGGEVDEFALISKSVQKADLARLMLDIEYPVGGNRPYIQYPGEPTPAEKYAGTSWEIDTTMQGRTIIGSGGSYTLGATGGSADAVVTQHSHVQRLGYSGTLTTPMMNQLAGDAPNYGYHFTGAGIEEGRGGPAISTDNTGESGTGKNMPPYIVVNYWKRIG